MSVPANSDIDVGACAYHLARALHAMSHRFEDGEPLDPCPRCGCTQRVHNEYVIEMAVLTSGRTAVGHRRLREQRIVHRLSATTGHLVGEFRSIDRIEDAYYKRIVDTVTGEVVHEQRQPLSEHRGRGSARLTRHESSA